MIEEGKQVGVLKGNPGLMFRRRQLDFGLVSQLGLLLL